MFIYKFKIFIKNYGCRVVDGLIINLSILKQHNMSMTQLTIHYNHSYIFHNNNIFSMLIPKQTKKNRFISIKSNPLIDAIQY